MVLKEGLKLPVHTPETQFFLPVHASCPPHVQTLPAASHLSTLVLPSQVSAVPQLQVSSPEHVSPAIVHVVTAHGSTKTKKYFYTQLNYF